MKNEQVEFKPQKEFPYYNQYKQLFPITNDTIFVFGRYIYTDKKPEDIPYDVIHHELRHLIQQKNIGKEIWIERYLADEEFRLSQELEAYRYQLLEVKETGDKNELFEITAECARNISSPLYGNIIKYQKALKLLALN